MQDYDKVCADAATRQQLDPVIAVLRDEFPNVFADQTGGFVMVARVTAADGAWIGITWTNESRYQQGDRSDPAPLYYVVGYESRDDDGTDIADRVVLRHIADFVRGFVRAHGGLPAAEGAVVVDKTAVAPYVPVLNRTNDAEHTACESCGGDGCQSCGGTGKGIAEFASVNTSDLRDLLDTWADNYDTVYDGVQALIAVAEAHYMNGGE